MLAVFDIFTSGISCKKVVLKSMTPISCLSATKPLNTHPSFSDIQTFSNKIIKHTPELFRKFQFKNSRATYGELVKQSSYGQRCFDKLNRSISDYLRCNSVECFFFFFVLLSSDRFIVRSVISIFWMDSEADSIEWMKLQSWNYDHFHWI